MGGVTALQAQEPRRDLWHLHFKGAQVEGDGRPWRATASQKTIRQAHLDKASLIRAENSMAQWLRTHFFSCRRFLS